MSPKSEDHLIQSLFNDAQLNRGELIELIRQARTIDVRDVELANSIVPEAGNYLPGMFVSALIRAEIAEEDTRLEIKRQKAYFARLSLLLPVVMRYFRFNPVAKALNVRSGENVSTTSSSTANSNFAGSCKAMSTITTEPGLMSR